MAANSVQLPLPIRLLNKSLALSGPIHRKMFEFDPQKLLAKASHNTGLEDFGSDYFREPLRRLCESLEYDAQLSPLGRMTIHQQIIGFLENRLKFIDIFKRHPEIADEEIKAPLFILGMPRTGTTTTHELMALDPQFRVPMTWECTYPFPPPETATYHTDPRIEKVQKELDRVDYLIPDFKSMHPMGAELPQECIYIVSHDFASQLFDIQGHLYSYREWLIKEDMTEVYHNHRRWLQLLQWKCPGDTWVLKSPQYLWHIEEMLKEYPDARVVQTHRDPVKVAMSIGNLSHTLHTIYSDHTNLQETTQYYANLLYKGINKTHQAREKKLIAPEKIFDARFETFRQGPVAMVRSIYEHFGIELKDEVAQRMQEFLDKGQEKERFGKHHYSAADSGLNIEAERARFKSYQDTYGIASEALD